MVKLHTGDPWTQKLVEVRKHSIPLVTSITKSNEAITEYILQAYLSGLYKLKKCIYLCDKRCRNSIHN